jgi:nucleoside recognition membrane protein YjiH
VVGLCQDFIDAIYKAKFENDETKKVIDVSSSSFSFLLLLVVVVLLLLLLLLLLFLFLLTGSLVSV